MSDGLGVWSSDRSATTRYLRKASEMNGRRSLNENEGFIDTKKTTELWCHEWIREYKRFQMMIMLLLLLHLLLVLNDVSSKMQTCTSAHCW